MKNTKKIVLVNKTYKLKGDVAPLTLMIPARNSRRSPLMYFDEDKGVNRALRYARNQKSPFEDEQDGNAILEPIVFEDGFLFVPKTNPVLQQFLSLHPSNGHLFMEVDKEVDATADVDTLDMELEAQVSAKGLSLELMETIGRVVIGLNVDKLSSAELKRDIRLFARKYPQDFLESLNDPLLILQNKCSQFLSNNLIIMKNEKDIYYNLKQNKKKLLTIPYGEDPLFILASFFQSDEGQAVFTLLSNRLKKIDD